jgi:N,N'-diacetyllegionaminate synthase
VVNEIDIGLWKVGPSYPCLIIAEAGVNHNGELKIARQLIDAAATAGANVVKFQTFRAQRLASPVAPKATYQVETTGSGESQLQMLARLELTEQDHRELKGYCRARGIIFLSTPFDEESADFLEDLGVPAFKVGSGEITNLPFLEYLARKQRPIILSTGMSFLGEVEEAVKAIRKAGNENLALLHCVSNYPAAPEDVNLRVMQTMSLAFQVPIGYSDHTLGVAIALAAVARGACIIEKHFTLDRNLPGPDHRASIEPEELKALVEDIRKVEKALGHGRKEPAASELATAAVARRSLVAAREIPAGTILAEEHLALKRPGTGIHPGMRPYLLGRTSRKAIPEGTLLTLEMLA